ncbi:hypothetical protein DRJ22_06155 [Candidatus Woesearchaeota archaeon]|nr:MAG: hypothetical protein DRJ22_06155 [Candidatus Woesearchaeota archaeon]
MKKTISFFLTLFVLSTTLLSAAPNRSLVFKDSFGELRQVTASEPMPVSNSVKIDSSAETTSVTATTSSKEITSLSGRTTILIMNQGAVDVYINFGATTATTDDYKIEAGQGIGMDLDETVKISCITDADTSVLKVIQGGR